MMVWRITFFGWNDKKRRVLWGFNEFGSAVRVRVPSIKGGYIYLL